MRIKLVLTRFFICLVFFKKCFRSYLFELFLRSKDDPKFQKKIKMSIIALCRPLYTIQTDKQIDRQTNRREVVVGGRW